MRQLTRIVKGLVSLALIVGLILGVPWFLWQAAGVPFPTSLFSGADLEILLRSGLGRDVFPKLLALIGWIIWAQLAWAFVVELIAVVRGRAARTLPVLPGLQRMAGNLITAVALLAQTFGSAGVAVAAPPPPELRPIMVSVDAAPPRLDTQVAKPRLEQTPSTVSVTVDQGDSWWALAERHLGSGFRWKEIRDANIGRVMPSGYMITDRTEVVDIGWSIQVPAEAETVPTTSADRTVTVERGDSLWTIAEDDLSAQKGSPVDDEAVAEHWLEVIDLNDQFADPDLIHPGDQVLLPPVETPAAQPVSIPRPAPPPASVEEEPVSLGPSEWDEALEEAATQQPVLAPAAETIAADPLVSGDPWWLVLALAGFASPVVAHVRRRLAGDEPEPAPSFGVAAAAAFVADAPEGARLLAVVSAATGDLAVASSCVEVDGWTMRRPGVFEVPADVTIRAERFAPWSLIDCGDLAGGGRLWINLEAAPVVSMGGADPNIDEAMTRLALQAAGGAGVVWWIGPGCPEGVTARSVAELEGAATFGAETARPLVFVSRSLDLDSRARVSAHLDWPLGAVVGWIPAAGRDLWRWFALDDGRLRLALPGAPLAWSLPDTHLSAS